MKIGLIVADAPHLKTEQVAKGLAATGRHKLDIVALPFVQRRPRSPLFQHRPDQSVSAALDELARTVEGALHRVSAMEYFDPRGYDVLLLTGGVLIPEDFVRSSTVPLLNCHPGMIPLVRGLDAFKWAVLEGSLVGNTLHRIDARVDLGFVYARAETPVRPEDTLDDFARRHYNAEIDLLLRFEEFLATEPVDAESLGTPGPRRMRMGRSDERLLPSAFEEYKRRFARTRGAPK